jgi:hypothetical protein
VSAVTGVAPVVPSFLALRYKTKRLTFKIKDNHTSALLKFIVNPLFYVLATQWIFLSLISDKARVMYRNKHALISEDIATV